MPFKKLSGDRYKSPSGKIMTGAQVRAYYASQDNRNKKPKKKKK